VENLRTSLTEEGGDDCALGEGAACRRPWSKNRISKGHVWSRNQDRQGI
jgi:hypothetical protein